VTWHKFGVAVAVWMAFALLGGCATSGNDGTDGSLTSDGSGTSSFGEQNYKVRKGDSVYAVSKKFNVPTRTIIEMNDLEPPYILKIGQRLVIAQAASPDHHRVRKGDTLYSISRKYKVSVSALAKRNRVKAPYRLDVGQRLDLPFARKVAHAKRSKSKKGVKKKTRKSKAHAKKTGKKKKKRSTRLARKQKELRPPPRSSSRFLWPVRGKVISKFGSKGKGLHNDGVNIAAAAGSPVRAAENGVVAYDGNELGGFGNLVLIKHSGNFVTAYAHNASLLVRRGQKVRRGQTIAKVGRTGAVGRPQLHFEIRKGRKPVNPLRYLSRRHAQR